ncbi:RNA polymerase sigma factor [Pumilibacter intestinalis]|uniref:RNA polymerase sigma factor n=1 Tax=Pumilibacter intestinalis TaxID=2941511 RepID=UPI00203E4889|nr:RNA polymerase sigma factor [Pumilibacter intestinalis]
MTGRLIELIRRLKRGDKNGFEEFYRLTKSAVWYVISRKLFDRQKAEDVMQETYVKFLNSLQKVDEEGNPMAYLLTIAKNKSLDEYKKNAKEQLSDEMEEHGGRADFYSPLADSPLLCLCKEKLAAEEFELLELTVVFGYRRVEAAKMLGKPVSTVNRQYHSVLKKVKKLYKEAYDERR